MALAGAPYVRAQSPPPAQSGAPEDEEVKLGRENAVENDKAVKLSKDQPMIDRVNRIGRELAAIANSIDVPILWGKPGIKKFDYTFKLVDDKDINAYSLPGGFIYVHTGLLEFVRSDDELAGVLAHEIAHASHHHMIKLMAEQDKIQQRLLIPALVIGALASKGNTQTIGDLLMIGNLYTVAKVNTYGVEAEKDSDQAGVRYMLRSKFKPVGLLTFMERLARKERLLPEVTLGIYRTHPPTVERVRALTDELRSLQVPIARRETDPSLGVQVRLGAENGIQTADVRMNDAVIARFGPLEGQTAESRAQTLARNVNRLLDEGLKAFELRLGGSDRSRVLARFQTLVAYAPSDAALTPGQTVEQLARGTIEALGNMLWQDQFNRM